MKYKLFVYGCLLLLTIHGIIGQGATGTMPGKMTEGNLTYKF